MKISMKEINLNIQTAVQTLILLIFSSIQCMEIKSKNNTLTKQPTLQLDYSLINTLTTNIKKDRSNPLLFRQRTKRLHLLQQLLDNKINISLSSKDENIKFWLGKDTTMIPNLLYDKFLSLLSYRSNVQKKVILADNPFNAKKAFAFSLQIDSSLLYFTATQPLDYDTNGILKKFLYEYIHDTEVQKYINNPVIPDQANIDTKNQFQQLIHDEDEYDLFMMLPHATQELLQDILLER